MTGGLMQLVAYGAQDIYLTGNPMITYFKVVYRRHTNFAMESIEQTFNFEPSLGTKVSSLIARNGDLIAGVYVRSTLPSIEGDGGRWIDNVGHYLLKSVEIDIGGQPIDKHYSDWLEIWSQLTVPAGQKVGYLEMIGQDPVDAFDRLTGLQADVKDGVITGRTIFVPLQFWFCRNEGLALPLIALQYHEVKIHVEFDTLANLTRGTPTVVGTGSISDTSLWVDYIYLDTDERRRFAQISHEYLIEQLQYNSESLLCNSNRSNTLTTHTVNLNFNHPVKELVWFIRNDQSLQVLDRQPANYTSVRATDVITQSATNAIGGLSTTTGLSAIAKQDQLLELIGQSSIDPPGAKNPIVTAKLKLNGHDRYGTRGGDYFNLVQTQVHTCVPESPGINVYSFALEPENHQPSGACNFSRIDKAQLIFTASVLTTTVDDRVNYPGVHSTQQAYTNGNSKIHIYAHSYNVLRIMSGMGGLAYSY